MATTYEAIATTTASGSASFVTFSSIASTWTDLVLVSSSQTTSGSDTLIQMQFNSDTGSNYSRTFLYGTGSTAGSGRTSNATELSIGVIPASSSSNWATTKTSIQNYSNSTTYKTAITRNDYTGDAAYAGVGLWRSTSAITSIKVIASAGNFSSGSTFTLYGIKAA